MGVQKQILLFMDTELLILIDQFMFLEEWISKENQHKGKMELIDFDISILGKRLKKENMDYSIWLNEIVVKVLNERIINVLYVRKGNIQLIKNVKNAIKEPVN